MKNKGTYSYSLFCLWVTALNSDGPSQDSMKAIKELKGCIPSHIPKAVNILANTEAIMNQFELIASLVIAHLIDCKCESRISFRSFYLLNTKI